MKEYGRSMVEMLGVLAVIGVLAIAGIVGYRTAMVKHQANMIINDINNIIVTTFTPTFDGINLADVDVVYDGEYMLQQDTKKWYSINLKFVPKSVCETIMKNVPDVVEKVIVKQGNVCAENNELLFYIKPETTNVSPSCGWFKGCADCVNGRLVDNDANCPAEAPTCTNGVCNCPTGLFYATGANNDKSICTGCSDITATHASEAECHKCAEQFHFPELNACYGCNIDWGYLTVPIENCNRCDNRYWDTASGQCLLCPDGQTKNVAGTGCE